MGKWDEEKIIDRIKQLNKKLKRKPQKRDDGGLYIATRNFFGTWNNAMEKAGYKVKIMQKPIIPDKLTPELSYFIGLLITDGHLVEDLKKKHYVLLLFTSYEDELKLILKLIGDLFSYKAYVRKKKDGWNKRFSYQIYINSKDLLYYFKDEIGLPTGAKSKIVRVPKIMFNTNKDNLINFVRGVMDGDGNISLKKPVNISSGNYYFLEDLKRLFLKLNLGTSEIYKDVTAYILRLYQKDNLEIYNLFYKEANLCYSRKRDILKINTFKNDYKL